MDTTASMISTLDLSMMVLKAYVGDLTDKEILTSPGDGCNSVAYQLGHLISSQVGLLKLVTTETPIPKLPEGFAEHHDSAASKKSDWKSFGTLQTYLDLFDRVNDSVKTSLKTMDPTKLDEQGPESMRAFCPTIGHVYILMATHPMMHVGQFVPVRRMLGKSIVM